MRKRQSVLAAVLLLAGMLTGCGGGKEENLTLNTMKVESYVTLGDYRNMTVEVADAGVRDEDWNQLVLAVYRSYVTGPEDGVTSRPVRDGDTVIIDYVGTRVSDGVAFQGGTAEGASLEIGSNSFIPGFESGLIGVMPGETVDLNLAFPSDYWNPEMADLAVVFRVTVQYILPGLEDMKDSVVAAQGLDQVTDVEGLRQYVYSYLEESAKQERLYNVQNAILEKLTDSSTVAELPEAFVETYRELFRKNIERTAAGMNTTADVYIGTYYGMTAEDFVTLYGEVQARQEILLQAIANEQNLAVGDEELDVMIQDYADELGYGSADELTAVASREQLRNFFMCDRVMEYLISNTQTVSPGGAQ